MYVNRHLYHKIYVSDAHNGTIVWKAGCFNKNSPLLPITYSAVDGNNDTITQNLHLITKGIILCSQTKK